MRRDQQSFQRQVALVSYGSSFLRKELALDDWYRHGVFFDARLQFRDMASKALLADDFTLWLGILAQGGATRLSLHPAETLGVQAPHALDRNRQLVAVHYPDRYQLWAAGDERAAWDAGGQDIPNAANYGGDVDCYLCVEERQGKLDIPATDWKMLAAAIAADLEISVPSDWAPAGPYFSHTGDGAAWAKMPLFVANGADALAHAILATLDREQAKYDNDTHPKNDNSYFQHLDEEGAAAVCHWGDRLDRWIGEVLLRAANIDPGANGSRAEATLTRQLAPPPPYQPAPAAVGGAQAGQTSAPQADGKWTNRLGMAVGIVVLSLFILALAKIVAHFPWLAVLIALPWALYMHYKD